MKLHAILASATAAVASTALAGPLLTVNASVGGYAPVTVTSNGVATNGRYSYIGGTVNTFPNPAWAISWNLLGDDSAVRTDTTFVTNGFRVQNLSAASQDFDIVLKLANPGPSNLQLQCTANFGGTITSDSATTAASIASASGVPMWIGQVNGLDRAGTGMLAGQTFTAGAAATNSFGPASGTWTGTVSGALTDIGYRMRFTLSPNSTALFSGAWSGTVVPAPGAFAMIAGAAGLVGTRRRRQKD